MTWVKICGITNLGDALVAVDAGADALGFVFYDKSPRKIAPEEACDIVANVPANVEKVGVFVDAAPEDIRAVASKTGLTAVQLHHKSMLHQWEDALPERQSGGVSKFIPVVPGNLLKKGGIRIEHGMREKIFALMLDSYSNGTVGGTGTTFDWRSTEEVTHALGSVVPVIVAGGLTVTNVAEAMHILKPWGVDVSSGVEVRPGKKDPDEVRAFITAVREADKGR
jgi:phosphoribosylanthranilate isomerase